MKQLLLVLLALLPALRGTAKCKGGNLWVWPTSPFASTNTVFVLSAKSSGQEVLANLNTKYPIYLVAANRRVRLRVREVCGGQHLTMQAVLVPVELLVVGAEYRLLIENIPEHDSLVVQNPETGRLEAPHWKVSASRAPKPIAWLHRPQVGKGSKAGWYVTFDYALAIRGEYLLKTTVQGVGDSLKTTSYLATGPSQVYVGQGLCSKDFVLADRFRYEVTFDVLDAQGRVLAWRGPPIPFSTNWNGHYSGK